MTEATNWWWVRHGPTRSPVLAGWTDVSADLSDTAALGRLSSLLPDDAVVVSSDLARAIQTADAICGQRRRLPNSKDIREINFGSWEGRTIEEIKILDPDTATAFWTDPKSATPPGGESWSQVAARTSEFADRLSAEHQGADIVAVAHFGTILTQIDRCANVRSGAVLKIALDNLSVSRISLKGGDSRLVAANQHA